MKVSLVIPSFNQAPFVAETLQSLFAQKDVALELIVVDGGSTDGTLAILERHSDRFAHFESERDRGQSHALNKGFAKATGDIQGWLCTDDLLDPGTLARVVGHFEAHPHDQLVVGGSRWIDVGGHFVADHVCRPARLGELLDYHRDVYLPQPSVFFRRGLKEKAGPLREDLYFTMDLDLWLRFAGVLGAEARIPWVDACFSSVRLHEAQKTQASDRLMAEAQAVALAHAPRLGVTGTALRQLRDGYDDARVTLISREANGAGLGRLATKAWLAREIARRIPRFVLSGAFARRAARFLTRGVL